MAETSGPILEGVFAVKKPPSLSSAQVLRELQDEFSKSKTFAPLLHETRRKEEGQSQHRRKRRRGPTYNVFKMGHGGTLDPLATGVLIVGIGRGTKHLQNFLSCTKTYETVVLFGKSTDTFDVHGKIVADAPYNQITRALVEENLTQFRGRIKQVPPIYSALKINGMKAYEYARSGKELPRQLESRDMQVDECKLLEWYEGGEHEFSWPAEQASEEDRVAARKLMRVQKTPPSVGTDEHVNIEHVSDEGKDNEEVANQDVSLNESGAAEMSLSPKQNKKALNKLQSSAKAQLHTHEVPQLSDKPAEAPAARILLTSSSGFYVRSFAHDLGISCESYGMMSELVRTRQSEYTVTEPLPDGQIPCVTYEDLNEGEGAWGPKLTAVLTSWMEKNPAPALPSHYDGRSRTDAHGRRPEARVSNYQTADKRRRSDESRPRRNSSSDEG